MRWAVLAIALGGCASQNATVQPVNIVSSDLCQIQPNKLSWDVKDTPDTIKGVRQFNARWDSRCGGKRPVS